MFNALWKRQPNLNGGSADKNVDTKVTSDDTGPFSAVGPKTYGKSGDTDSGIIIPPEPRQAPIVGPSKPPSISNRKPLSPTTTIAGIYDLKGDWNAAQWLHWLYGRGNSTTENVPLKTAEDTSTAELEATKKPAKRWNGFKQIQNRLTKLMNAPKAKPNEQHRSIDATGITDPIKAPEKHSLGRDITLRTPLQTYAPSKPNEITPGSADPKPITPNMPSRADKAEATVEPLGSKPRGPSAQEIVSRLQNRINSWSRTKKGQAKAIPSRVRKYAAQRIGIIQKWLSGLADIFRSAKLTVLGTIEKLRKNIRLFFEITRSKTVNLIAQAKRLWLRSVRQVGKSYTALTILSTSCFDQLTKFVTSRTFRLAGITALAGLLIAPVIIVTYRAFETQELSRADQAWQILAVRSPGNAGKRWALDYLNASRWPFKARGNLSGLDLSAKTHSGPVYLRAMDLPAAYLTDAQLELIDLSGSNLTGANLSGANLTSANLAGARLQNSHLTNATLNSADLSGAILISVEATSVDAKFTDFAGADLSLAVLPSAQLTAANMDSAILDGADLWSANLTNGRLDSASFVDASFVDADLTDASLLHADLTNARLTNTNISGANFVALVDKDQTTSTAIGVTQNQLLDAWAYSDNPPSLPSNLCVAVFSRVTVTPKLTAKGAPQGYRCGPNGVSQDPGAQIGPQASYTGQQLAQTRSSH